MSWPSPSRSSAVGLPSSSAITRANARPICCAPSASISSAVRPADVVGLEDRGVGDHVILSGAALSRLGVDVRSLEMAFDQAQEGGRRRASRPALHQAGAGDHGRRPRGRGRPGRATRRWRWRSRRRATPRCRRTTSSARSQRAPARASTPTRSRPSLYEGYGPGGVALLIEALTDNRNRTGADVRHLLSKHGGNLGEPGSVSYLFDKQGVIVVDASRYDEDDLIAAIDAGAQDIVLDEDVTR